MAKHRISTQVEVVGCKRTFNRFCVAIGKYRQLFRDMQPLPLIITDYFNLH
jgi:hypothetical protein